MGVMEGDTIAYADMRQNLKTNDPSHAESCLNRTLATLVSLADQLVVRGGGLDNKKPPHDESPNPHSFSRP